MITMHSQAATTLSSDAHQRSAAPTSAACSPCGQTGASEQWSPAQLSAAGPAGPACLRCCPLSPGAQPQTACAAAPPAGRSACCQPKVKTAQSCRGPLERDMLADGRQAVVQGEGNPAPLQTVRQQQFPQGCLTHMILAVRDAAANWNPANSAVWRSLSQRSK